MYPFRRALTLRPLVEYKRHNRRSRGGWIDLVLIKIDAVNNICGIKNLSAIRVVITIYLIKSFSQDLSMNFIVLTVIKPAEPHSLLSAGQYSLPSADS